MWIQIRIGLQFFLSLCGVELSQLMQDEKTQNLLDGNKQELNFFTLPRSSSSPPHSTCVIRWEGSSEETNTNYNQHTCEYNKMG